MSDPKIITSPLSGPFKQGDITVDVQIYRLEHTEWTLEMIDADGKSTVWSNEFESADAAMAEFLRSVEEEGLVGIIYDRPALLN